MDKKEAQSKVAKLIKTAEEALSEAQSIANEAKISFSWGGPAYGMGGYYEGDPSDRYLEDWQDSDDVNAGWSASSQSC